LFNKVRYAAMALMSVVVLIAGFAGGCSQEKEVIKIPYVEWA
jgi:hypothetical protein